MKGRNPTPWTIPEIAGGFFCRPRHRFRMYPISPESQPYQPSKAFGGLTGYLEYPQVAIDREGVPPGLRHVEIDVREEVRLVDQEDGGFLEHEGVLGRLVGTLGGAQEHDLCVLAQLELSGTDKISHVLHYQETDAVEVEGREGLPDHVTVDMTGPARVYLDDGDAEAGHPLGVAGVLDVAFNNGDPEPVAEGLDGLLHQGGLPGAGELMMLTA